MSYLNSAYSIREHRPDPEPLQRDRLLVLLVTACHMCIVYQKHDFRGHHMFVTGLLQRTCNIGSYVGKHLRKKKKNTENIKIFI